MLTHHSTSRKHDDREDMNVVRSLTHNFQRHPYPLVLLLMLSAPVAYGQNVTGSNHFSAPSQSLLRLPPTPRLSSRRASNVRPEKSLWDLSMERGESLAERLLSLSNDDGNKESDFESAFCKHLEAAKEEREMSSAQGRPFPGLSPMIRTALFGGALLVMYASSSSTPFFLSSPVQLVDAWKALRSALSIIWIPLLWFEPTRVSLLDALLLAQVTLQPYFEPFDTFFPTAWKTLQPLLVAQIWSRVWKRIYPRISFLFDVEHEYFWEWMSSDPPFWLKETHSIIVGSTKDAAKGFLKKATRKVVEAAGSILWDVFQKATTDAAKESKLIAQLQQEKE